MYIYIYHYRFGSVCPQRLPDIANQTAALERMPKGRLEYLKRLLPYLQNQSEDCLYLNIYVPIQEENRRRLKANRVYPSFGSNGHEGLRLSCFVVQRSDEVTFASRTKKENYETGPLYKELCTWFRQEVGIILKDS
uniref:COesterase domain-containing protein n=1 Tax=Glossina pallidipes TaxID=7398 RepID=A0A1A9Z0U3_GLOPL